MKYLIGILFTLLPTVALASPLSCTDAQAVHRAEYTLNNAVVNKGHQGNVVAIGNPQTFKRSDSSLSCLSHVEITGNNGGNKPLITYTIQTNANAIKSIEMNDISNVIYEMKRIGK